MNEILIHLDEAAPISVMGDEIERAAEGYLEIRLNGELVAVFAPETWTGAVMVPRVGMDDEKPEVPFRDLPNLMEAHRLTVQRPRPEGELSRAQMITDIRKSGLHVPDAEALPPDALVRAWRTVQQIEAMERARPPKSTPESLGAAATEG